MLFNFFIAIVFIAEIIIASALLIHLYKWSLKISAANKYLDSVKPKIKYIMKIAHKISEQLMELAPYWAEEAKTFVLKMLINNIKASLAGIALYSVKKRWKIKRIKGLKTLKLIRFLTA